MKPTPYRPPHEAGSDQALMQAYRQLKAEMLELGRVNEGLRRELDDQRRAQSVSDQAKEAQQEAFGFLGQVIDDIPMAFQLMSVQEGYRVAMCNKAARALYGLTREETLGRTLHDLWPKTDADRMHTADLDLVAGGVMQDFPDRVAPTRHRGPIRVHLRKFPLKDASGAVTHILITAEDITERLAAQARLQQSRAHFQSLTRLSSDWYWEIDDQFRFTEVSNTWSDQIKSLAGDFMGRTRWELDDSARNQAAWALHRAQLERRETFRNFEFERLDKEGHRVVICISGEPIADSGGNFAGYRGVGTDISARRQAETAFRASEARCHAIVGALAEGVILRDADGRIVDCNASTERILGKTLGQMKGLMSIAPDWAPEHEDGSPMLEEMRPLSVARRTGLLQSNVVVSYRKPDGSQLWLQVNLQPLFEGATSSLSGFVSTITDITERKRARMEIVRLNVNLENRVLRRTAELEAANRELEAFSYSVAHDLRAPLSTIDGFSVLLQKAMPPESGERARHFLYRIRSGVQRMGELTDALLSLAQLSRTSLQWATVDMSEEAAAILKHCAENDLARMVKTAVEPGLRVRADRSLLRQVLENLIANAWKFSSKKPCACISVGQQVGADGQPVYFVRDNGAGFDMAYADKLFGPFQRLHSQEEFSGSGIGLATVQRIIHRHGGKVWARASVEHGCTFYFTLGSDAAQVAPGENQQQENPGRAGAQPAHGQPLLGNVADARDADLVASDGQFRSAFEHAAIGMTLLAVDKRRLRVNSAFCRMLGYSEAELLARTNQDITHPDDVAWDVLQSKRAVAGEIEAYQCEKRYLHQSGRLVWAHLSCSLVRDEARRPLHFISQIQDITERKQVEQILRDSEERFRALTELSSDWFWEQDENFRFVMVSGGATHVAGVNQQSAFGKTRWELAHVNMDDSVWAAHKAQLERHAVFRDFKTTRLDEQGNIRCWGISGTPIFDAQGRFTGYRGIGRDITKNIPHTAQGIDAD
jgi:PAS domain S-box-containing protein